MKKWITIMLAPLLFLAGVASANPTGLTAIEPAATQDLEVRGVIRELDFASETMVVGGYQYKVAPDASVTIRGTYGAYTLLQVGMKVAIVYVGEQPRMVSSIRQIPDNQEIEEY